MKKYLLAALMLGMTGLFIQCNKDADDIIPDTNQPDNSGNNSNGNNNNDDGNDNGNLACPGVADDQIKIGDDVFIRDTETINSYLNICMEYDFSQSGVPFLKHERSLYFKDGDYTNVPAINILLGNVPEPGTTTTYSLDDGMWVVPGSSVSSIGKARISIESYVTKDRRKQSWFSNEESGTVEAVSDANGNIRFNFSNVKLVQSGGSLDAKLVICGNNIICQK